MTTSDRPSDPTRLKKNMTPPAYPIDPNTGMVSVINIKTGKIGRLHPVDLKEQLACAEPQIRLATEEEAPPQVNKSSIDYSGMPFEKLREYAQEAGIGFAGKSRAMIEEALNDQGFVPKAEE